MWSKVSQSSWRKLLLIGTVLCIAILSSAKVEEEDSDVEYANAPHRPAVNQRRRAAAPVKDADDQWDEPQQPREDDDDLGKIEEAVKDKPKFKTVKRYNVQSHFYVEIVAVSWVSLAIAIYFLGKKANEKIAQHWLQQLLQTLRENFTMVGDNGNFEERPVGPHIIRQSNNVMTLYSSGRKNCRSCLLTFNLRSRQDLLTTVVNVVAGSPDELEILIEFDNKDVHASFTLAVVPTRGHKRYQRDHPDLAHIKSKVAGYKSLLPESLTVLTDSDSAASAVLTERIAETLVANSNSFLSLHITDANPFTDARSKHVLQLRVALPSPKTNDKSVVSLVQLALQLVDRMGSISISDRVRRAVEAQKKDDAPEQPKKKERDTKDKQQEEEIRRKVEEKKRREKELERERVEERLATLPPDQRRKLESKLARQEIKKKQRSSKNKVQFLSI